MTIYGRSSVFFITLSQDRAVWEIYLLGFGPPTWYWWLTQENNFYWKMLILIFLSRRYYWWREMKHLLLFLSAKLVVMSLAGLQQNSSIDCINRYCLEIRREKGCCIWHGTTYSGACIQPQSLDALKWISIMQKHIILSLTLLTAEILIKVLCFYGESHSMLQQFIILANDPRI